MSKMVRPIELDVTIKEPPAPVVRGEGVRVTVELSSQIHERLQLEKMRRKRQGLPGATVEDLARIALEKASDDWPHPIGE